MVGVVVIVFVAAKEPTPVGVKPTDHFAYAPAPCEEPVNATFVTTPPEMTTSDASSPLVCVEFIPKQTKLADKIRAQVEACRVQKGTREVELE